MSGHAPVLLEVRDGIAHLTLNRPDEANAIDVPLATALRGAVTELRDDRSVRVVLLSGAGARFCGGGDVTRLASQRDRLGEELTEILTPLHRAIDDLVRLDAPVVAAVQGSAAGAGLALVAAADLVVTGASAKFVFAYNGIGLTPDASASWHLPRVIGLRRATELALTNRVLTADEALNWGLVNEVVPDGSIATRAGALAERLARGPTRAFAATLRLFRESVDTPLAAQLERELETIVDTAGTQDAVEGVAAFSDRRPPEFRGS